MLGVLMLVSSSLHAQDPAEELKLFIKAQQAKMEEQSKVLEQQKILILEQSKLLISTPKFLVNFLISILIINLQTL